MERSADVQTRKCNLQSTRALVSVPSGQAAMLIAVAVMGEGREETEKLGGGG